MKVSGKKIFTSLIAFVLTIALLLAGQYIWNKTQIEKPLNVSLKEQAGVSKWEIEYDSGKTKLKVTFNQIDNLQKSYKQLTSILDKVIGIDKYSVDITSQAQPKLDEFYEKIQPILYEGLATGRYAWMVEQINKDASANGLTTKIQFDQKYVYVQIFDQSISLYKLIPREYDENHVLVYNE